MEYTWREGSEDERTFEGIAVKGYRLAMLTEADLSQEELDKDISILSVILPFIQDRDEAKKIEDSAPPR